MRPGDLWPLCVALVAGTIFLVPTRREPARPVVRPERLIEVAVLEPVPAPPKPEPPAPKPEPPASKPEPSTPPRPQQKPAPSNPSPPPAPTPKAAPPPSPSLATVRGARLPGEGEVGGPGKKGRPPFPCDTPDTAAELEVFLRGFDARLVVVERSSRRVVGSVRVSGGQGRFDPGASDIGGIPKEFLDSDTDRMLGRPLSEAASRLGVGAAALTLYVLLPQDRTDASMRSYLRRHLGPLSDRELFERVAWVRCRMRGDSPYLAFDGYELEE